MSVSEDSLQNIPENDVTISNVQSHARGSKRSRKRRISDDVVIVESSTQGPSPPITRRSRVIDLSQSIVDLTSDEVVDLTSPEPSSGNSSDIVFVSDMTKSSEEVSPVQNSMRCPICLEAFSKLVKQRHQIISTMCGHIFCDTCIYHSIDLTKKCPSCRCKLTRKKVHQIFLPV